MSQLGTVYATKRRRRNGKSLKPPPKDGVTKSNPSKRHRERLNAELDLLASLLPFEQNILSKLDRLSILRLAVSYLRTKSYFQVMHKEKEENGMLSHSHHHHDSYRSRELGAFEHGSLDGDMILQALNGFLMILTCEGEVFFATHSIESYLGFHQSDIVHQSVYELVHSEDREELQRQLLWNSFLPADLAALPLSEALAPDKINYLERSFTVRFRCLLDNTSGFLRLDIRGRVKILHGQNRKTEDPPLGLFAYCTPFGPPSLLEIPQKENMFKSKHKLDFSLVSMDQRGKFVLGYSDGELASMGGYDLVHYDDLSYVASAHQELLKTGASGMIAYRYQKKDTEWQWLQTSSRLVYKNSKPDFVICTHRQLMEEEGRDLLGKRTMDFKVSYLDTGLASTYFSEADQLIIPPSNSPITSSTSITSSTAGGNNGTVPVSVTPQRTTRRYKTQLRDFLSTCRSKRKLQQQTNVTGPSITPPSAATVVEYIPDPTAAAAVAAAYSNLNPMYSTSPYGSSAENIYMTPSVHSTNFYPVTDNLLFNQYRLQGAVTGYYPEYPHPHHPHSHHPHSHHPHSHHPHSHHHHPHSTTSASSASSAAYVNGFLPYDGYAATGLSANTKVGEDGKWQHDNGKYYSSHVLQHERNHYGSAGYDSSPTSVIGHNIIQSTTLKTPKSSPPPQPPPPPPPPIMDVVSCSSDGPSPANSVSSITLTPNNNNNNNNSAINNALPNSNNVPNQNNSTNPNENTNHCGLIVTPKIEHSPPVEHYERQTVLMWGSTPITTTSPTSSTTTSSTSSTNNSLANLGNNISTSSASSSTSSLSSLSSATVASASSSASVSINRRRSPSITPTTTNGIYLNDNNNSSISSHHIQKLTNHMVMSPPADDIDEQVHHQNAQPHLKWNGVTISNNSNKNSPTSSSSTASAGAAAAAAAAAAGIQIYQIHPDSGVIENSSIYSSQVSHSPSHLNGTSQIHNNNNSHLDHHQSPTSILHLSHHHHQQQQQLSPQNHLHQHHNNHHQQQQQQQQQHHQQQHHNLQQQHQHQQQQQQHFQHLQHQQQQQQQPLQHPSSQQSIGSSCEVWSPAYSQYQYFTYHHAPQHASTQSSLVDTTNQSHCLSRNNGYMEHPHHHHHHHPQHGTISPISQLSHTHPTRTSITRTGVLCCPSLR